MAPLMLQNPVQRYAWGSKTAIPDFLGQPPDGEPWAELWMGAHPRAPSQVVVEGDARSLDALIREQPAAMLGVAQAPAATLPFLFKVLAAAQPLSIQCHPDSAQARVGFDREEAAGVPRDAPHRLYPDPTPKPELIVAQSVFVGLKGFRPADDARRCLSQFGLDELVPSAAPEAKAIEAMFGRLMRSSPDRRAEWLARALARAARLETTEARWVSSLAEKYPGDPGALAPLMLNIVQLQPGQALFLRARELHAYLEGTALELMANSDNVLRGGLTAKHVDVPELLRVLDFTPRRPELVSVVADASGWRRFSTPASQFSLRRATVEPGVAAARDDRASLEIVLCTAGQVRLTPQRDERSTLELRRGQSAAIPASTGAFRVSGAGEVFLAAVGAPDESFFA